MRWISITAMALMLAFTAAANTGQLDSASGTIDTVRPTVSLVTVESGQSISVAFSESMLAPGITTPANYVLSGTGTGNLASSPATVGSSAPYLLTWSVGEMLNGGAVTVTVTGVQDSVGNVITTPNSGNGTGIGSLPTGTLSIDDAATPGYTKTQTVNLTLAASDSAGVAKMRFGNDGATWIPADWASAPAYATSYTGWNLTSGDGPKTVYAQYQDNAGNVSTDTVSDTVILDATAPTLVIGAPNPAGTAHGPVVFTLTFADNLGVIADQATIASKITVNNSGTATATPVVSGSGNDWLVEVDSITGSGSFTITVGQGAAADAAGNETATATSAAANVDPNVLSMSISAPSPTLTNTGPVTFHVFYSNATAVTLNSSMISLSPLPTVGGPSAANIVVDTVTPLQEYTVTLMNTNGDGALGIHIDAGSATRIGPPFQSAAAGDSVKATIDNTPPTATITLPDSSPTLADVVHFDVHFSESVGSTFGTSVVTSAGTLSGTPVVSGSGPDYTVALTLANPDADGTIGITIGFGVSDAAGNPFAEASSPLYTIANWRGFVTEPQDTKKYTGDDQTFGVTLTSGTASYQWKRNVGGKALENGPTTPTWTLTGLSAADRGQYWCEVTYLGTMFPTRHAGLSIESHLQITDFPAEAEDWVGVRHTFTVTTSGGYAPLAYIWKKDGTEVADTTVASYSTPPLTLTDSAAYSVDVYDANGDKKTASTYLTVAPGMPVSGLAGLAGLVGLISIGTARRMRKPRGLD